MEEKVVIEWKYSPDDYFENDLLIEDEDYRLEAKKGNAKATMSPEYYDSQGNTRDILHSILEWRFLADLVFNSRKYDLSQSSVTRIHPSGKKEVFVYVESFAMVADLGIVETVITKKDGTVISDSKADREEEIKSFRQSVQRHSSNEVVRFIFDRLKSSVDNPETELVELYAIKEAVCISLGGQDKVIEFLGIKNGDFTTFGKICNNEPVRQGRHSGKKYKDLRDATRDELEKCRTFARNLIEKYLFYLDEKNSTK